MHGSVWEWVADWYREDYYANAPREDPAGPHAGRDRLRRGGTVTGGSSYCRSAFRCVSHPLDRRDTVGFRVVCEE